MILNPVPLPDPIFAPCTFNRQSSSSGTSGSSFWNPSPSDPNFKIPRVIRLPTPPPPAPVRPVHPVRPVVIRGPMLPYMPPKPEKRKEVVLCKVSTHPFANFHRLSNTQKKEALRRNDLQVMLVWRIIVSCLIYNVAYLSCFVSTFLSIRLSLEGHLLLHTFTLLALLIRPSAVVLLIKLTLEMRKFDAKALETACKCKDSLLVVSNTALLVPEAIALMWAFVEGTSSNHGLEGAVCVFALFIANSILALSVINSISRLYTQLGHSRAVNAQFS